MDNNSCFTCSTNLRKSVSHDVVFTCSESSPLLNSSPFIDNSVGYGNVRDVDRYFSSSEERKRRHKWSAIVAAVCGFTSDLTLTICSFYLVALKGGLRSTNLFGDSCIRY